MADKDDTGWQRNFERQAGIRRCILLHGDVLDVVRWDNDYLPLIEAIPEMLKRSGFDRVIRWDRFAGVSDAELWRELAAQTVQQPARRTGGTPYGAAAAPATNDPGTAPVSADDFFAVAHHHLVNVGPQRCAFIVDWTQYLFGLDHSLSEEDRQRLLILSKAIRNAPALTDQANRTKPANLLVLVANRLGSVPLGLYQNNPAAQEIVVPPPRRGDREQFVTHNIDKWRLRKTLTPTEATFNDFIDALDGLTLRDLQNLIRLSYQLSGDPPTPERLINLYKYGEQRSPWEELNRTKLKTIAASLEQRVKGQSDAIDKVRSVVIRAYTGLSGLQHSKKQKMPKGVLFFVGPTGVGKTELAKSLAEFLYGDEDACIRFDMSEFNHEHSDQRLVGAPPGYLGHQEGGQLTNAVKKRPFSVLLFDEIEKAHVRILDKFLQILEDGRLTDGRGETVFFSETVIIFTSNIGAAEIDVSSNFEEVKDQFQKSVRNHFIEIAKRPELLNRIGDNIVPFNFVVDSNFLVEIARSKLKPLRDQLKEKYRIKEFVFEDEDKALMALARVVDQKMGGRGVLNEMVKRIYDPLAEFLFEKLEDIRLYAGRTIKVTTLGKAAEFDFELE